jgi:hypothetical protein
MLQQCFAKMCGMDHIIFTPDHLPRRLRSYAAQNPRGYGYWVWKPYLIRYMISLLDPTDRLFWMDAAMLPFASLKKLQFSGVYIQKNIFHDPREWCNARPFESLPAGRQFFRDGAVPDASLIAFEVEASACRLADRWYELCLRHHLLADADSGDQLSRFTDHRHDQSVLGYAAFEMGIGFSECITQYGLGGFHVLHHRLRLGSIVSFFRLLSSGGPLLLRHLMRAGSPKTVRLSKKYLYK